MAFGQHFESIKYFNRSAKFIFGLIIFSLGETFAGIILINDAHWTFVDRLYDVMPQYWFCTAVNYYV